jgi:two-component system NtrC family sensor kinase
VIVATGLLLLPLAGAAIWSADRTLGEREREVEEQAGTLAITAAAYLNQYLSGTDSIAAALVRDPAVVKPTHGQVDRLFGSLLHKQPLLLNVLLTDPNGRVMGSGIPPRPDTNQTVSSGYVKRVVAQGTPVVSELMTGQVSGRPTVVLAYPVTDADDHIVGVLGFGLDLAHLETLFGSIPLPANSVVTLTDAQSRVLARTRDAERYIGEIVTPDALPPNQVAATTERTGVDGIPRFYGNAVVDRGPWLLSVGIPTVVARARIAGQWQRDIAITVFGVASVLTLVLILSNVLTRALGRLQNAAQRIAQGDLSPPETAPVPIHEVTELQDAFVRMAANLRATRDALDQQVEQERKTREALQSLQRQVVRQERLTAVGLLVSGVAHEVNNPLQAILGTAELLERDANLSQEAREEIAFVKTQSGRAREIIRNLSRFSSQQSGPPTLVDLREVIGEVVQLRRRDLDTASIVLDVEAPATRPVLANFTEVEQVTLNFVINAQQSIEAAGRGKGRILIRLTDLWKRVRLEVLDDGPGVAPEDEPKLFQPFFTTKPVGKGTGLGLSVSYGIIDSYGGSIGYRTNDWGGALFFFELPAADTPAVAEPPADVPQHHDRSALLHQSVSHRI